jgi:hypothetical protein
MQMKECRKIREVNANIEKKKDYNPPYVNCQPFGGYFGKHE